MYPKTGFTKGQVIDYYTRVAPVLLPHLRDRPLTLKRYPNGVESSYFYEKNCPSHAPEWVRKEEVMGIRYCVCDDLSSIVWLANRIERPTVMAFDLDPGPPAGLSECCEVAVTLRETLGQLGLECFPKTSGSKGLQIYVPLNGDDVDYDEGTKPFSNALARHLAAEHPKLIVSSQTKELRKGKVLIDWSQNDEHKTTVCVYSLRARERPTVSTPVTWDEVEQALAAEDAAQLTFDSAEVLERVERLGDLFGPAVELEQELPKL